MTPREQDEWRMDANLQEQQLVEGLEDVDGGLVDGAHDGAPCVHNVTHGPHDDGCSARVQA